MVRSKSAREYNLPPELYKLGPVCGGINKSGKTASGRILTQRVPSTRRVFETPRKTDPLNDEQGFCPKNSWDEEDFSFRKSKVSSALPSSQSDSWQFSYLRPTWCDKSAVDKDKSHTYRLQSGHSPKSPNNFQKSQKTKSVSSGIYVMAKSPRRRCSDLVMTNKMKSFREVRNNAYAKEKINTVKSIHCEVESQSITNCKKVCSSQHFNVAKDHHCELPSTSSGVFCDVSNDGTDQFSNVYIEKSKLYSLEKKTLKEIARRIFTECEEGRALADRVISNDKHFALRKCNILYKRSPAREHNSSDNDNTKRKIIDLPSSGHTPLKAFKPAKGQVDELFACESSSISTFKNSERLIRCQEDDGCRKERFIGRSESCPRSHSSKEENSNLSKHHSRISSVLSKSCRSYGSVKLVRERCGGTIYQKVAKGTDKQNRKSRQHQDEEVKEKSLKNDAKEKAKGERSISATLRNCESENCRKGDVAKEKRRKFLQQAEALRRNETVRKTVSIETSNDTLSHNSKKVAISDVHLLLNDPDVLRQIDQQIEEENSCVEQPDSGLVEANGDLQKSLNEEGFLNSSVGSEEKLRLLDTGAERKPLSASNIRTSEVLHVNGVDDQAPKLLDDSGGNNISSAGAEQVFVNKSQSPPPVKCDVSTSYGHLEGQQSSNLSGITLNAPKELMKDAVSPSCSSSSHVDSGSGIISFRDGENVVTNPCMSSTFIFNGGREFLPSFCEGLQSNVLSKLSEKQNAGHFSTDILTGAEGAFFQPVEASSRQSAVLERTLQYSSFNSAETISNVYDCALNTCKIPNAGSSALANGLGVDWTDFRNNTDRLYTHHGVVNNVMTLPVLLNQLSALNGQGYLRPHSSIRSVPKVGTSQTGSARNVPMASNVISLNRRPRQCRRCRIHGMITEFRGHNCPNKNCDCSKCRNLKQKAARVRNVIPTLVQEVREAFERPLVEDVNTNRLLPVIQKYFSEGFDNFGLSSSEICSETLPVVDNGQLEQKPRINRDEKRAIDKIIEYIDLVSEEEEDDERNCSSEQFNNLLKFLSVPTASDGKADSESQSKATSYVTAETPKVHLYNETKVKSSRLMEPSPRFSCEAVESTSQQRVSNFLSERISVPQEVYNTSSESQPYRYTTDNYALQPLRFSPQFMQEHQMVPGQVQPSMDLHRQQHILSNCSWPSDLDRSNQQAAGNVDFMYPQFDYTDHQFLQFQDVPGVTAVGAPNLKCINNVFHV